MDTNKVIKKIKPSRKEQKEMEKFIEKLLKVAGKLSKGVTPMICGSVEKDTWLSKKYELDLFLLYDPRIPKKTLEAEGLKLAKNIIKSLKGKHVIAFAEHPYLRGEVGKFQIDVVPCYELKNPEKIKSAVDRTPHHVKFVKKNLLKPDDVRLLKQFCIANDCYGADVKTLGLSGYLCELLIIKYGSFEKCVNEASKWRAGHVITFSNSNPHAASMKFKSPLIVVDPVDRNRNVGAAVSTEKFYAFVRACNMFTKNPRPSLFFKKQEKPYTKGDAKRKFKERGTQWYMIRFKRPKVIEDILFPQLKRCCKSIEKILGSSGFKVLRYDFYCSKECVLFFEMEIWQTPCITKNMGPDVYSRHAEEFIRHYKDNKVFIEDEKWVVETKKDYTHASKLLGDLLALRQKSLLEKGVPSKIAPVIINAKIYENERAIALIGSMPKDFGVFVRKYFERDMNVF